LKTKQRIGIGIIAVLLLGGALFLTRVQLKSMILQVPALRKLIGHKTVDEQIETYGEQARGRLRKLFESRSLTYPPDKLALLGFKNTRKLDVYVSIKDSPYKRVVTYPIINASGSLGPKLRQGDMQVPEGFYRIEALEPNTPYHLGLRLNYPNAFDIEHARLEGRDDPGGDILIHGSNGSIGCLAMGDVVAEDLFVLANDTKSKDVPVILCPVDLREFNPPPASPNDPAWLPDLYKQLKANLKNYPAH
jgi:hypothetical protein